MILYVVDLQVDAAVQDDYLRWLRGHVKEMTALPGFLGADILERLEPASPAERRAYSVHYRLRDRAAFDAYLARHAARMRAQGERFGRQVGASRGLLQTLE